jgi:hypothetical protein
MRRRSTTIDAETEEEYIQIMKTQELNHTKNLKHKQPSSLLQCYKGDELRFASNSFYKVFTYLPQMTIKSCTLEEQERVEEEELANNFHNLNLSFKERDTDEFIHGLTHLSKDSNFGFFPKCSRAVETIRPFSLNSIDNFSFEKLSNVSTNDCGDEMIMQSFLLQNLEIFEDVLKVMVLGDKCSGKSLLISKLLNKGKNNYFPTTSLEIHNKIVKLFGKFVKIELFDTSANILSDSLIKSKYPFKVSLL